MKSAKIETFKVVMMRTLMSSLLAVSSVSGLAQSNLDNLKLSLGSRATVKESKNSKARVIGFDANLQFSDKIEDDLNYFINASGIFETGSSEIIGGAGSVSEYAPFQGIYLNNAGIAYTPANWFLVKAGSLNQAHHESPLLIGNVPFAAVEEKVLMGDYFYTKATQAIPTNNQLRKRLGAVDDGTPFFGIATLGAKHRSQSLFFKTEIGYFSYNNLSSSIAEKSKQLGNSISGVGEASTFNYKFQGTNFVAKVGYLFDSGLRAVLFAQYLYNSKAPTKRNKGQLVSLSLGTKNFTVKAEHFRNESDTAPAFYNEKKFGHNNIEGYGLELLKRTKLATFKVGYTANKVLERNFIQSDSDIYSFSVVKNYVF